MPLSLATATKVNNFIQQSPANEAKVKAHLQRIQNRESDAGQQLAQLIGISPLDALELAANGIEAVATDKNTKEFIRAGQPNSFQANRGGGGVGATLRSKGLFDSIITDTVLRKGSPDNTTALLPLVSNLPDSPFEQSYLRTQYAEESIPELKPPREDQLYPRGDQFSRDMVISALDNISTKMKTRLEQFEIPIELNLKTIINAATKEGLDTVAKSAKQGDATMKVRKALAGEISDSGAKLIDDLVFPSDPEREFDPHTLKNHTKASFIAAVFDAMAIPYVGERGAVHEMMKKHGVEKNGLKKKAL